TVALRFGSPMQHHVAFRKLPALPHRRSLRKRALALSRKRQELAEAARLKLRFGIECLYVKDWKDVSLILKDTSEKLGETLQQVIDHGCVSREITERRQAHVQLRALGQAGRRTAILYLTQRIKTALGGKRRASVFKLSEWIYSLGTLRTPNGVL